MEMKITEIANLLRVKRIDVTKRIKELHLNPSGQRDKTAVYDVASVIQLRNAQPKVKRVPRDRAAAMEEYAGEPSKLKDWAEAKKKFLEIDRIENTLMQTENAAMLYEGLVFLICDQLEIMKSKSIDDFPESASEISTMIDGIRQTIYEQSRDLAKKFRSDEGRRQQEGDAGYDDEGEGG